MLTSQLHEGNTGPSENGMPGLADTGEVSGEQPERNRTNASEIPSNHTRIWSEHSGLACIPIISMMAKKLTLLCSEMRFCEVLREVAVVLMEGKFQKKGSQKLVVSQELKGSAPFKYQKLHQLKETSKVMDMVFHNIIQVIGLTTMRMIMMMITMMVLDSVFSQHHHTMKINKIMFPV